MKELNNGDTVTLGDGLVLKQEGVEKSPYVLVQSNGKSVGIINGRLKEMTSDLTYHIYLNVLNTDLAIAVF
jgi:hypothetical protein